MNLRTRARHLVTEWAERLEALELSPKHPLVRLRELALTEYGNTASGEIRASRVYASASRVARPPPAVPVRASVLNYNEADRIMRTVGVLDMRYRKALYLVDGLGLGQREAAQVLQVSRSTLATWYEGGLAAVMFAILTRSTGVNAG